MNVISLVAENVKSLKAVRIQPDGNLVIVAGANGAGKSTVLDCIWWALAGAEHVQEAPIRTGKQHARIEVALGDGKTQLIVERTFSSRGTGLKILAADGARLTRPQELLDSLLGHLTFEPLEFMRLKPQERYARLLDTVKLDVDLGLLKGQDLEDLDKRREANREAKRARTQAEGLPAEGPAEPVDVEELTRQLGELFDRNRVRQEQRQAVTNADSRVHNAELAVDNVRQEILRNKEELERLVRREEELTHSLTNLKEHVAQRVQERDSLPVADADEDPVELRERLAQAGQHNQLYSQVKQRRTLEAEADGYEKISNDCDKRLALRIQLRRDALAKAELPVPGLGLDLEANLVTLDGLPLEQASTSQQLRVSLAVAMAANPRLRVVLVRHGNDLDDKSLGLVAEQAAAAGYQVWVERIDPGARPAVVIEDGEVRHDDKTSAQT